MKRSTRFASDATTRVAYSAGGSIGFADPDQRIGFGYVMNQMQQGMMGGMGGFALIAALYEAL